MGLLEQLGRGVSAGLARFRSGSTPLGDLNPGGLNLTGYPVSERNALTLPAYFACINVIASDFGMLGLRLYRRGADGSSTEVLDHHTREVLAVTPDDGESYPMAHRSAEMGHCLGWGNAYSELVFDGDGNLKKKVLMDPGDTKPDRRADQGLYYRLKGGKTLPPWRVFHLSGLGFNGIQGYTVAKLFRQSVALGLAAETQGATFFGNGSQARGFLRFPGKLGDAAKAGLRKSLEGEHRGPFRSNRLAILEYGAEWVQTSIDPVDAQFLATRSFQVVEICRVFRVPPHKVMDLSRAHFNNLEQSNLDYITGCIGPWCERYEQLATLRLLSPEDRARGLFFEHDLTRFLRGAMRDRAEYFARMFGIGVFSQNDIRRFENLNPIDGGDRYYVPVNMRPIDQPPAPAAA